MRMILLLALAATTAFGQTANLPYENPELTPRERAIDLVGRMTLDEKVSEMGNASAAIPRLGVPAYDFWNEGLHGVARSGYATMFPQAIGMAATWDAPLFQQIGDVISTEARAKNNQALREGNHDIYFGLTFWSPNINIFRDPRWGRGQETYGEDPFLTAQLAVNFIHGLQGDDPTYFKVIATPKHFAVHSGPESDRHKSDVDPSAHDLWDTYLPQFRAAIVDAKADSIMCAYNSLFGQPACGSKLLLEDVLRKDWHFQGFVTSDCGAIDDFFKPNTHMTEPDAEHADKAALLAGTDTNCGSTYERLGAAVKARLIDASDIDASLVRLFEARMKLGQFDPAEKVPYTQIPFSAVHSPENAAVAQRAADESMVLLKNDGILPLVTAKYKTIAVIGPNGASLASLEGNYNGTPHDPVMPVDALQSALQGAKVIYAPGAPFVDGFAMPVARTMLHPAEKSMESGLKAEYYASPSFAGTPVQTHIDPELNFDWSGVNPLPGSPASGFAVRWSGYLGAPKPGSYTFTLRTGRCRGCAGMQNYSVKIDGQQVTASAPAPAPGTSVAMRINGTTGLPEEAHQEGPGHFTVSFAEGQQHTIEVTFTRLSASHGTGIALEWTPSSEDLLPAALDAANHAGLVVAMLGLSPNLEGEEMPVKLPGFVGGDRTEIALPASQESLLEKLSATGKPLVVVLLNGSALATAFADQYANALLEAWYPGEAGARAIADTLIGINNPSGRLPFTFYASESDLPPFSDYSMKNRTYRYFTGTPLYRFGYGLSYTRFIYSKLKISGERLHAGDSMKAEVEIRNSGELPGDEVAQLYLIPPFEGNGGLSPKLQLAGFQRVSLKPGESRTLSFTLDSRLLSEVDAQGTRVVQPGHYAISIGGSQPSDSKAPNTVQTAKFTIEGTKVLPR
jgi:beta-glucosidase